MEFYFDDVLSMTHFENHPAYMVSKKPMIDGISSTFTKQCIMYYHSITSITVTHDCSDMGIISSGKMVSYSIWRFHLK